MKVWVVTLVRDSKPTVCVFNNKASAYADGFHYIEELNMDTDFATGEHARWSNENGESIDIVEAPVNK